MILIPFLVVIGFASTFGFAHAINRKKTDRITFVEWFVSAGVGCLTAASIYSLLH